MKRFDLIKDISRTTITAFALVGSVYAVEPLSDTEMGEAVVLDPFGATAAGGPIDLTLTSRETSATQADENNQDQANDPNLYQITNFTNQPDVEINPSTTSSTTTPLDNGITIFTTGVVNQVRIDQLIDNTGVSRGSQTINNINVNNTTAIHSFR